MLRAIDFHGLKGVEFSKGEYTALLIPEMGANLVRLANTRLGAEILRTPGPGEIETFRSRPQVFGLPILFPPNRIADGRYVFEGRTYQYPITIERERNYHHGVLKSEAFLVSKAREMDREVMIECRYYANAGNDAVYRDFPHEFKCKITYRLTAEGLEQEVVFFNRSETRMPLGVGFHTPLTIPFAGGIDADYVMRLAVGEEVELDGRNLPTGRRLPLSEQFSKLRREGLQVTGCGPIEAGFTLREIDVDGKPFRGALVEHLRTGVRTCYEVDEQTTYWTLWNNGGQVPYCCPEPQTWTTNAPNAADQQDVHGFDVRRKGELLAHGFGFEHADPQRVEVQRRGGKHHVVGDDRRVDVRNVLAVVLTGPRLGGVGADDDGRRGAEIARAARKAFHALLRLHDHQPLGLAVGASGSHAARFEDQLQFLRLHLPGEVFAAGVPLFRQFQKIHLQRF